MIISHKHKFIFIKTSKTASTSLEIALSGICGKDDIITPFTAEDEVVRKELGYCGPQNFYVPFSKYNKMDWLRLFLKGKRKKFYNHMPAAEIKSCLKPHIWDKYYKFCFERNPWEKVISHYYWRGGEKFYPTFGEYLYSGFVSNIKGFDLYTIRGLVAVDKIYKYEELDEALYDISVKLGLSTKLEMPSYKAKGHFRTDNRPYNEVFTKDQAKLIEIIFAREIKLMGYRF